MIDITAAITQIINGLFSAKGLGSVFVLLGSHALLFDVAKAFATYAKGGSFSLNFDFGNSSSEWITRGLGAALMVLGWYIIGGAA